MTWIGFPNQKLFSPGGHPVRLHDDARRPVPAEHDAAGLQELHRRRGRRRRGRAAEAVQEPRGHRLLQGGSKDEINFLMWVERKIKI